MKHYLPLMLGAIALTATPALANKDMDIDTKVQMKVDKYFPQIDANDDGNISKAEHDRFGTKKFEEADANDDGMISRQEMVAMKRSEMEEMKDMKRDMKDKKDR